MKLVERLLAYKNNDLTKWLQKDFSVIDKMLPLHVTEIPAENASNITPKDYSAEFNKMV